MADNTEYQKLPAAFRERLNQIISKSSFHAVADSFTRPWPAAFRINPLLADREIIRSGITRLPIEIEDVSWYRDAFVTGVSNRDTLINSDLYRNGWIYLQNLSSMIPPLILEPASGQRVLDLAAAPGSKTLQIAAALRGEGELTAVEVVRKRYYKLLDNLNRHGAGNVQLLCMNGENIWKRYGGYFDKILLDAPCSTEARFKTFDPGTWNYWSLRKIREMVRKQSRLLYSAIQSLKVDGLLVYSTCSFAPEENEGVIQRMLDKFGFALEIEPVEWQGDNIQAGLDSWKGKTYHPDLKKAVRILPDRKMEGFFICKIRKRDATIV